MATAMPDNNEYVLSGFEDRTIGTS